MCEHRDALTSRWPGPRLRRALAVAALLALAFVAGCQHRLPSAPPPASVPRPSSGAPRSSSGAPRSSSRALRPGRWTETGLASWYGVPFNGRRAADGETFDMYKMVAAHRTLPFGSLVRVTDLQNGRHVVVRIIDRGPFVRNRIIDLSFGAARVLHMIGPGVAPVRLQLLSDPGKKPPPGKNPRPGVNPQPAPGEFTVQVGAFAVRRNAERLRRRLGHRWGPVFIDSYDSGRGLLYRVRVGEKPTEAAARRLAGRLRKKEGFRSTFVVRLDR